MPRQPEIGNVQLYPANRPLRSADKNGYVLKFYCPIQRVRIRKNCGTRDRREARQVKLECQRRLLNGEYVASGGAITAKRAAALPVGYRQLAVTAVPDRGKTWDECYDRYRHHRDSRVREMSLQHALSRIQLAERILTSHFTDQGQTGPLFVRECFTLDLLEYVQERLLAGDEGRYDSRSPNTVNSTMGAIMAFVRFCHRHEWIERVPPLEKLDADEVMKGRPVTEAEFERMLAATPKVVGQDLADSWTLVLRVLWESGFRIGDAMDFSWDDNRHICPVWPLRENEHPTIEIPSTQKNGAQQTIPMLPGLERLLRAVPEQDRQGWVLNPLALGGGTESRLSKDRVSRVIAAIGREAGVVVRQADARRGHRIKYASAHDLRRGCAVRLFNAGVSAEALMVVMRHADFATTQKFYGAMRSAQSAAAEVQQKLAAESPALVGGFLGGRETPPRLTSTEAAKLKQLLAVL